jgi:hypothetical protein
MPRHHASERDSHESRTYISAPHKGTIYVLELARPGSRKLLASAMPEAPTAPDYPIPYRSVPLQIRRAAKAELLGAPRAAGTLRAPR